MTQASTVTAPQAPAGLGQPAAPDEVLEYLDALGVWRDRRRDELDRLDEAALASPETGALTKDVILSMALWQAVADRHDAILGVWDSGRVGRSELERISALVWGRLDHAPGAMNISLPEACRLSDALAASLRTRLALDPGTADVTALVRRLRQQIERIRDLVAEVPSDGRRQFADELTRLDRRLVDLVDRAKRGADIGGLVDPLVGDVARAERDLIVGAATRQRTRRSAQRARDLVAELTARGAQVRAVEQECVAAVDPAPRLAVPDVAALGPVPAEGAALESYLDRLDAVSRALGQAHAAYRAALEERDQLRGLLEGYHAKAGASGDPSGGASGDLAEIHRRGQEVLAGRPVDLIRLRRLVAAYQAYLSAGSTGTTTARTTTAPAGGDA